MAIKRIDEFLGAKSRPDKVRQFEHMSIGKTKAEVRELELNMLMPEPLQGHIGEERRYFMNSEHSVKMVFRCQEDMELFGEFINITEYIEKSITDIKIIMDLFRAMKTGKITYNKKAGEFTFHSIGGPAGGPSEAPERDEGLTPREEKHLEEENVPIKEEDQVEIQKQTGPAEHGIGPGPAARRFFRRN